MLFIIIAAVLIAFSYEPPNESWRITGPWLALTGMAGCMVGNWLLGELAAWFTLGRLRRLGADRERVMCRYQWLRWFNTAVLLASFVGLVHGLDWPGVVAVTWRLRRWVLVDDLLVLAPFIGSLTLGWLASWRVDDFVRTRADAADEPLARMSRWEHVDFLLRHHLGLVLAPLFTILAVQDVVRLVLEGSQFEPSAEMAASMIGLAAMLALAPVVLKLLWRAAPLPAGPLRERLERLSRRLGFRATDILVWQTNGTVINAAVAGILPRPRYVLLSDGLLQHFSDDEVAAVFGHEVGHIRHHHLWFYVGFLLSASFVFFVTMTAVGELLFAFFGHSIASQIRSLAQELVLPLVGVLIYFGVCFGFLSRRFERQADVFGCRAVSCGRPDCAEQHAPHDAPAAAALCGTGIQTFIDALEKIARLNGMSRKARSWRHFSIAKRVEFLASLATEPDREQRFQRIVLALKAAVIIALVAGGLWACTQSPAIVRVLGEITG